MTGPNGTNGTGVATHASTTAVPSMRAKAFGPGVGKFIKPTSTGNYRPTQIMAWFHPALREGRMTWWDIPAMSLDPHVQIGYRVLCAPLSRAKWKIKCNNYEAGCFIHRTLRKFWDNDLSKVSEMLRWGTVAGEVQYKLEADGMVAYEGLRDFRVVDTRPHVSDGEVIGFRLANLSTIDGQIGGNSATMDDQVVLYSPRAFWLANEPECGSVFGRSRYAPAFAPWMEKAGKGGARDARKLWAYKYAFGGGVLRHPSSGEVELPDGTVKSCQDYAMEVVEKAETGFVMAMPSDRDDKGEPLWEWIPPTINGSASELQDYPNVVGKDIWLGLGIMPEVIEASETGSGWSGRSVPFLTFLVSEDQIVRAIITAARKWVCDPLVLQNYGDVPFEIEPESLVPKEEDKDGQGGQPKPGEPGNAGQPGQPGQPGRQGGRQPQQPTGGNPQAITGAGGMASQGPVRMSMTDDRTWTEVRFDDGCSLAPLTQPMPVSLGMANIAERIEAAISDVHPDPSEAQRAADNFSKGHVWMHGLDIAIECPKGSVRRGVGGDGKRWEREMCAHYGHIRGTGAADKDNFDVYIGPDPQSELVFVIDQVDADGHFDESKAMFGYSNARDARRAYLAHFPGGWKIGGMKAMPMDAFKEWLENGKMKKPVCEQTVKLSTAWDESKHHRGQPKNAGQFGPGGSGSSGAATAERPSAAHKIADIGKKVAGRVGPELGNIHKDFRELASLGKSALSGAEQLEHGAKDFITRQVARLPEKVRLPVVGIFKALYGTYIGAQSAVDAVAQERGFTTEERDRLAAATSTCDAILGMKILPAILTASGVGAVGAGAASFIPAASLAYLAYSTARDSSATMRAARAKVKSLLAKKKPVEMSVHDVSGEARDESGKWTSGSGGSGKTEAGGKPAVKKTEPIAKTVSQWKEAAEKSLSSEEKERMEETYQHGIYLVDMPVEMLSLGNRPTDAGLANLEKVGGNQSPGEVEIWDVSGNDTEYHVNDGNHRLVYAMRHNIKTIPMYVAPESAGQIEKLAEKLAAQTSTGEADAD